MAHHSPKHTFGHYLLLLVISIGLVVGGIATYRHFNHTQVHKRMTTNGIDLLPKQANSKLPMYHLAKGVLPPTNRWYSGLAFNKIAPAVFPTPLSAKLTTDGFSFGLPNVTSSANTISGGNNPAVQIGLRSTDYQISRGDAVSVRLTYIDGQTSLGDLTMSEGSPFVTYQARTTQAVTIPAGFVASGDRLLTLTVGTRQYGLALNGTATMVNGQLQLTPGSGFTGFATPDGMSAADLAKLAHSPLQQVDASYQANASVSTTTLRYRTTRGETVFAALPHQSVSGATMLAGSYQTIYGPVQLYRGTSFRFDTPLRKADSSLNVATLTAAEKAALLKTLQVDAANNMLQKTDSYYGSKELYRTANLYLLAKQLGQSDIADSLHDQLMITLNQWLDPASKSVRDSRYFYYDTTVHGLVAATPSFGSELFNDHHFHYGYFLHAAAAVSQYDTTFRDKNRDMINLIADDIAAPEATTYFPQRRVFDPYFSHSWASGNGSFEDGNNQESSSEAINAWNGLALWAQADDNRPLQQEATWLLSSEIASARAYWTAPDLSEFKDFQHGIVALNWGGKRDYATFFSAEPNALLGIQLIPMSPAMDYLVDDRSRVDANLSVAAPANNYNRQFGDYMLMYRSLTDKSAALTTANSLDSTYIDDANSRSYMLAWIMSH